MQENITVLADTCSHAGIKPAMMELPYPPLQVSEKNQGYANLLSIDYCGPVSELSAITQYINNESRSSISHCLLSKTILSIAMAEMMHLQKLGSLISLLGGQVDYTARQANGRRRLWTPEYLTLADQPARMISAGIESEQAAIHQYMAHIKMIHDENICAVLARIIKDEQYHIMLLRALMD